MNKYQPANTFDYPQRTWPAKKIIKSPVWCTVDLRDGNQALAIPMNPEKKMRYFKLLTAMGFKEIEISFPSASKADFEFTRSIIDKGIIPQDCTIQILTQAREHLIKKSFEAISGCRKAIVHLYNSTSPAQREIVFRKSPSEIIDIAVSGVKMIREAAAKTDSIIQFEYSPESFSQTEMHFASDICNAVIDAWQPSADKKMIINLPSTVEISNPLIYADQIEFMNCDLTKRDSVILSVHTHNDRGCAVAAAEMALLAGAERVEGTLFGNGERTGNVDIVTMILNLYSQGIVTDIDVSNIPEVRKIYEECTSMPVHPRHPYAGDLVFTAFSGSHQDAISKGLAHYKTNGSIWNVPYLPIDPIDIGRSYESIIRVNSQSGKGGAAFIMESVYGIQIPKEMHPVFGTIIQREADLTEKELSPDDIYHCFRSSFIDIKKPYSIAQFEIQSVESHSSDASETERTISVQATLVHHDTHVLIEGTGNGCIDALTDAIKRHGIPLKISSYHEHNIQSGSDAKAIAFIGIEGNDNTIEYGAGIDTDITYASVKALIGALNRKVIKSQ
jgi:2-isopropylmalate synthase